MGEPILLDASGLTDDEKQRIFEAALRQPGPEVPNVHLWTVEQALGPTEGSLLLRAYRAATIYRSSTYGADELRASALMAEARRKLATIAESEPNPYERVAEHLAVLVAGKQSQFLEGTRSSRTRSEVSGLWRNVASYTLRALRHEPEAFRRLTFEGATCDVRRMRVNIQRSNLRALWHPIASIESLPNRKGFVVVRSDGHSYPAFPNISVLCEDCGVKPEQVRAAVEAEGYEIAELEIRRIRLEGMDPDGVISGEGMRDEYSTRVLDWQASRDRLTWADTLTRYVDVSGLWWRPKSYSVSETLRLEGMDSEGVISYSDMRGEYLNTVREWQCSWDRDTWTDARAAELNELRSGASRRWWRPKSYSAESTPAPADERTNDGRIDPLRTETLLAEAFTDERVERTSEGRIDPEHEPNPYEQIALDLAALVADKQRQYGDSAGRTGAIMRVLYPNGIGLDEYDRALLIVRVLDKLSRLATNKQDLGGESPWRDIAGYALLALEKGF